MCFSAYENEELALQILLFVIATSGRGWRATGEQTWGWREGQTLDSDSPESPNPPRVICEPGKTIPITACGRRTPIHYSQTREYLQIKVNCHLKLFASVGCLSFLDQSSFINLNQLTLHKARVNHTPFY